VWIKQALTRVLLDRLPADAQARMAADVVAWLCADLPPAEQREKIEKLGPRLLKRIRAGQLGLRLVVYYHLLRLPPFRWLDLWGAPAERAGKNQLGWLLCRWY
jgi:hypothetical protein